MEQLTIFDNHIDREATIHKVKQFFDEYPRMVRLTRRDNTGLSSPRMDGMPRGSNYGNSVERRLVQSIYAKQVVKETNDAINACDEFSKVVLRDLYLYGWSDKKTIRNIGYSESQYYHHVKPRALLEFAELYMLESLQVFKTKKQF